MAKDEVVRASTGVMLDVFVQNAGATNGAGLTGLTQASSGLTCYYHVDNSNTYVAMTLVTATLGTFTANGFIVVDGTNMPGMYQLMPPNAAFSNTTARRVTFYLQGVTNMAPCVLEIALKGVDTQDAVHGGMSSLPNTAVTTNASLITSGTSTDQLSVSGGRGKADVSYWNGTVVSTPATAGIPDINVKNINNVAATSVTTINANLGTTQAITFDGNNYQKVDLVDIAGSAVSASSAQLGVNVVNIAGHAATLDANNLLQVDLVDIAGSAVSTSSAQLGVQVVSIEAAAYDANFSTAIGNGIETVLAIDGSGEVTVGTNNDKTGYSIGTGGIASSSFAAGAVDSSAFAQGAADKAWSTATRTLTSTGGVFRLAKNTALANFPFLMTDSTTHAPKTGLTVTATRRIDNGSFASCANSASEIANGWYTINLAASDLNGDTIAFRFTGTNADDLDFTVVTQP